MFCIYIGFTCIIYSGFTTQHPASTIQHLCVINLTFQVFFINLLIWIATTSASWNVE